MSPESSHPEASHDEALDQSVREDLGYDRPLGPNVDRMRAHLDEQRAIGSEQERAYVAEYTRLSQALTLAKAKGNSAEIDAAQDALRAHVAQHGTPA